MAHTTTICTAVYNLVDSSNYTALYFLAVWIK